MPRKHFRKYLPTYDRVLENRFIARFGSFLHHPNLWHLNRDSVAGGVAVGLFSGLVPGPLQILTALLIAVPLRVNLPVAMVMTFYTNPFTIGPLYFLAYEIGTRVVGGDAMITQAPGMDWANLGAWMNTFLHWTLSLGKPLAIGLVVLAVSLAITGYFVAQLAWRVHVALAWRRRARLRRERSAPPA
jgi:uncharacterized protein (DUF2062 family)